MQKTRKILVLSLAIFVAVTLVTTAVFAKKDESKTNNSKSDTAKAEKVKNLKNFEKPTATKSNAAIHKEKVEEVSADLMGVATEAKNKGQAKQDEKTQGNSNKPNAVATIEEEIEEVEEELAEELEEVAEEIAEAESETVEAMEEVEKEKGFKKFFLGPDYKNLGQLRSSLVHNRNQIRKLTQLSQRTTDEDTQAAIQEQLMVMTAERERIKTVITDNEGGFSLLGWVFRFINGYPDEDVDNEDEDQLENYIEDAITDEEETDTDTEAGTDTDTEDDTETETDTNTEDGTDTDTETDTETGEETTTN